jgi:tetratricopeptide (TPR) repeat protein
MYKKEVFKSRLSFNILGGIVLVLMLIMNSQTRPTYDEAIERAYGKASLEFYLSLGKDTSFLAPFSEGWGTSFPEMKYYGNGFEIFPALYSKFISSTGEFRLRHVLNTLFGFLSIWFAALIAIELRGYLLGMIVLLIMLLSPTFIGLSSLEDKVIPLSLGYTASVYFLIRILKEFPDRRWLYTIGAILSIALAVSIRIAGIVIVLYWGLFAIYTLFRKPKQKQMLKKSLSFLIYIAVICFTGILIGLLFYPNFFRVGFEHISDSLKMVKEFKETYLLFEGKEIYNKTAPWYYLFKIFSLTVPLFILGGFVLFLISLIVERKLSTELLILLFIVFFPLITLTIQKASVYNGWRHIAFIYPSFCVLASLGILWLFTVIKNFYLRFLPGIILALLVARVVIWMINYTPYNYVYYNLLAGDYKKNINGVYEMEFYSTGTLRTYDWLWEKRLKNSKVPVIIFSNNPVLVEYAKDSRQIREGLSFRFLLFSYLSSSDWDYAILSPRLLSRDERKQYFPPPDCIHMEVIKKIPIAALVERKNKLDFEGINLIQHGEFVKGLEKLEQYYRNNPKNYQIWPFLGNAYFYTHEYKKAIQFFGQFMKLRPAPDGYFFVGASFFMLQDYEKALTYLRQSLEVDNEPARRCETFYLCGESFARMGDMNSAIPYYEACLKINPGFQPSIYALFQIYTRTNDIERANHYRSLLRQ